MKNNNAIGERIKTARKFLELTQSEFSSKLGISRSHISNIENGNESPSQSVILLMCAIFPIDLMWLQSGVGKMIAQDTKEEILKNNNNFDKILDDLKVSFKKNCSYAEQENYTNLFIQFKELFELCFKVNNDNPIIITEIISFLNCMLNSDSVEEFKNYKYKIIADLDEIQFEKRN